MKVWGWVIIAGLIVSGLGWLKYITSENVRLGNVVSSQEKIIAVQYEAIVLQEDNADKIGKLNIQLKESNQKLVTNLAKVKAKLRGVKINEDQTKCDSIALPYGYIDSLLELSNQVRTD